MGELIRLLREIQIILCDLLRLSRDKRVVVVSSEVEKLEVLLREETGLLAQLRQKEEARQRIVITYALRNGLEPQQTTLSTLLEKMPPGEERDALHTLQQEVSFSMKQLEEVNSINAQLLMIQQEVVHFMLESSSRPTQLGTQYSFTGADAVQDNHVNLLDFDA